MSDGAHFIRVLLFSKADRIILVLTFLLKIFVDLTVAIGVGDYLVFFAIYGTYEYVC